MENIGTGATSVTTESRGIVDTAEITTTTVEVAMGAILDVEIPVGMLPLNFIAVFFCLFLASLWLSLPSLVQLVSVTLVSFEKKDFTC